MPPSTPGPPPASLAARPPGAEGTDLPTGAVSGLGVFAQGLAAAAPSAAIASVPGSLFLVAGAGAFWAAVEGGVLALLVAAVIALQARRTVSSGSLGTYAGNGLGPWAAFLTGWALITAYVGFAASGVLGAVLYATAFLQQLGLPTGHPSVKVGLLVLASAAALYLPYRGVNVSVTLGLGFEVISLAALSVILIACHLGHGPHLDLDQFRPSHLGEHTTLIAAVVAVASFAGFESAASLGPETRNAHHAVPRAVLRLVLALALLYLVATYSEVLGLHGPHPLGADSAPISVIARNAGVDWVTYAVDLTLATSAIVLSSAVINAGARGLFTLAREGALPRPLARVHRAHQTPHVAVVAVGLIGFATGLLGTLTEVGRLQWELYVGIVSSYACLFAYLLVAIATPLWLRTIRALTPAAATVSTLAAAGILAVIYHNLIDAPEGGYRRLPSVFASLLLLGLARFLWLTVTRPRVAARLGSIQTLSETERSRLHRTAGPRPARG